MEKIGLCTLIIWFAWLLPSSCIDDKTSGFKTDGSPITIAVEDSVFYLDFGTTLVIDPDISQKMSNLPLKYEWRCIATDGDSGSDSLRFISTEEVLNYNFPRAGVFQVRLRVENQYGSSFQYFTANVRAPFEQGIVILSNDEQDNSRLSFLRLKEENEVLEAKPSDFNTNAFRQANPDVVLRGARDMIFTRKGELGGGVRYYVLAISSESVQKIYLMNGRYFLIENLLDVSLYLPDAYPTILCGNGDDSNNEIMFGINDKNGNPGNYGFASIRSFFIYEGNIPGMYDKIVLGQRKVFDRGYTSYIGCFIDNSHETVYIIREGYTRYSCGDRFVGKQIMNTVFIDYDGSMMFVATEKDDLRQVSIHRTGVQASWENDKVKFETDPYTYSVDEGDFSLTADSKMVANLKYNYVFYNRGNELYRWVHLAQDPKLPSEPDLILEDPDDEITCMEMSTDQEHLWVCVYNKNARTTLKGKLLIVNPVTMQIEKTIEGISDRALKVMWKPITFHGD